MKGATRIYIAAGLGLALTGIFLAAIVQPVLEVTGELSLLNGADGGATELAADLAGSGPTRVTLGQALGQGSIVLAQDTIALPVEPSGTTLLVLGPRRPPSVEEAAWLSAFVAGGGRLLIADERGETNAFLEAANAEMRVGRADLRDLYFQRTTDRLVTDAIDPSDLTAGVEEVVLSGSRAILMGNHSQTIASTSASAWEAGGAALPRGPGGPFVWMAQETVGQGDVLLVADASLFSNGMRGEADNAALVAQLAEWSREDGRVVVVDQVHTGSLGAVKIVSAGLRSLPGWLRGGFALMALLVPLAASLDRPAQFARALGARIAGGFQAVVAGVPPPSKGLVEQALEKHPDWDENTLRHILAEWRQR